MSTDLLNAYANERVDLVDFEFLSDSGFQESLRQPNAQFLTNPDTPQRSWILDGFDITAIPATKQVQVDLGRAILGQREGAIIHYGALTTEGDATKTIDMGPLSLNSGYGLYIRFEYVDGSTSSRIFWNPAGTGSEVAQSVATRRLANWSMRIELSSPGGEWLKIATLDNTGTPVVVTPEQPYYFEGRADDSFKSGWSADGGGVANDRNADRVTYGVKDLQTFTAAMRQCVEDIKGRGLRRWWDRDIGGMNIGFDADPVEDRLAVGDANFYMDWADANNVYLYWDTDSYFRMDRVTPELDLWINSALAGRIEDTGIRAKGIAVSSDTAEAAVEDQIICGDDAFRMEWDDSTTDSYLRFSGTQTYFHWDDSADELITKVAAGTPMKTIINGVLVRGLVVDSSLALSMETNAIQIGNANFKLDWDGTDPYIYLGTADDYIFHDISASTVDVHVEAGDRLRIQSTGIYVWDQIQIGNDDFKLQWNGTDPYIYFDDAEYIHYDVSTEEWFLTLNSNVALRVMDGDGLSIEDGLVVGDSTIAATPDEIYCDGSIQSGGNITCTGYMSPVVRIDSPIGQFGTGITVGYYGTPENDAIHIQDITYTLKKQEIQNTTATTASTVDVVNLSAYSSGDMASGFGGKVGFKYGDSGVEYPALEIEWYRGTADDRSTINFHTQRESQTGAMHTFMHVGPGDNAVFGRYIDPSLDYSRSGNDITWLLTANSSNPPVQNDLDYAYLSTFIFVDTLTGGAGVTLATNGSRKGFCASKGNTGRAAFVHGQDDDDIEFHSGGISGTTYQEGGFDATNNYWQFGSGGFSTAVLPGAGGMTVRVATGSADTDCALAAYRTTTTSTYHVLQVHSNVGSTGALHFNVEAGGDCRNTSGTYTTISDESTKDFIGDFYASPSPLLPYDLGRVFATIKPIHFGSKLLDHTEAKLFGFRGSQVEKVLPPLARRHEEDGLLSVNLTGMIPVLWEAVRQIMSKLDMLGTPV